MPTASKSYAIYAGSDEKETLAPASLGRHRDLEVLQYRLSTTPDDRREQIRERWGLPNVGVWRVSERARALRQMAEDAENEDEREEYKKRLRGLQSRLESAQRLEPITYMDYIEAATELVFDLDSVKADNLDAGTVRRAIDDFLFACEGTSREEVEKLQESMSGQMGSALQALMNNQTG